MGETVTETDLVPAGASATYYAPTSTTGPPLGTTWTGTSFNDSSWSSGSTGLGFDSAVNGFAATVYQSNITVASVATANTVISNTTDQSSTQSETAPYVNYTNTPSASGNFSTNSTTNGQEIADWTYPGMTIGTETDNYVMQATGTITIPTAGYWTFCANTADGFSATINGVNFQSNSAAVSFDTIHFASAGTYPVTFMQFANTGNSYAEFSAAPGSLKRVQFVVPPGGRHQRRRAAGHQRAGGQQQQRRGGFPSFRGDQRLVGVERSRQRHWRHLAVRARSRSASAPRPCPRCRPSR